MLIEIRREKFLALVRPIGKASTLKDRAAGASGLPMTTETMATGQSDDPVMIEAADFLLRVQAAPRDGQLRAEVEAWLARDGRHQRAWDQVRQAWTLLGEAPQKPEVFTPPAGARRPRVTSRVVAGRARRFAPIAAALAAACLVVAVGPTALLHARSDVVTGLGERRAITLADGSRVILGPKSAIAYANQARGRDVRLISGQAWFEVEHDARRPFVVRAGAVEATDLGTAFEVRRQAGTVEVSVAHGLVGVAAKGVDAKLGAGDRIVVTPGLGQAHQERLSPDAIAPWRDGYLLVRDAKVEDVVAELRRYQPGVVIIADQALAHRRVTGLYSLDNPEAAMRALVAPGQGRVRRLTPFVHVLSAG
ncbi:FecR family protein [Caulobacter segnis]|uniref:FecR family protein n=1 Tax=Caulobacter segnis TaxID=88688 RepID=UPI001CBC3B76|nr:FecR domain-containing protein [Caulobacter segnis]UAL10170.1 FecR domain-containing protein [Caulobacter segnis]